MFNDHVGAERDSWKFPYKGGYLLPYAERLLEFHYAKEKEAREKSAELLRDVSVNQNDARFAELKRAIGAHGQLKEQLEVFVMEFSRDPGRTYLLGLGDVTFFELTKKI